MSRTYQKLPCVFNFPSHSPAPSNLVNNEAPSFASDFRIFCYNSHWHFKNAEAVRLLFFDITMFAVALASWSAPACLAEACSEGRSSGALGTTTGLRS